MYFLDLGVIINLIIILKGNFSITLRVIFPELRKFNTILMVYLWYNGYNQSGKDS